MCYEELNQHIYRYLIGNKTKSAIMLTAPWGTGKSFYIQNHLKPFLEGKEKICIFKTFNLWCYLRWKNCIKDVDYHRYRF